MARFRLSRLARADLAGILARSGDQWGPEMRRRYAAMIATALRQVASDPAGAATRDRSEILDGIRRFHLRHACVGDLGPRVKRPVHMIFYPAIRPGLVEIVRVLHERMEPSRHISESSET
ncbi:MAG: type II toxin-antitoxin system RelE/ParE family toxin [Xanthobacteraceae bacterium]|jgi:toxin ParE1/3/4